MSLESASVGAENEKNLEVLEQPAPHLCFMLVAWCYIGRYHSNIVILTFLFNYILWVQQCYRSAVLNRWSALLKYEQTHLRTFPSVLSVYLHPGCRGGEAAVHSGPFITGRLQGEEYVYKPAHDTTRDSTGWGELLSVYHLSIIHHFILSTVVWIVLFRVHTAWTITHQKLKYV